MQRGAMIELQALVYWAHRVAMLFIRFVFDEGDNDVDDVDDDDDDDDDDNGGATLFLCDSDSGPSSTDPASSISYSASVALMHSWTLKTCRPCFVHMPKADMIKRK